MLQTRIVTTNRTTGVAAGPSQRPFSCGETCLFFQRDICQEGELRGPLARYVRRQPIYAEGDRVTHCFKVVEGAVRLTRILSDGHRQVLNLLLPGDTFGIELADTYPASAEAVGDVVVLKCPRACIDERNDGDHRHAMLSMLSQSLCAVQDHLAMLGHQGARQRVASYLLKLAVKQNRADNQAIDLPAGRQDIADYLGLTIETTCRTLTDLKLNHAISAPNRHQIVIRSLSRLEALAEGDD